MEEAEGKDKLQAGIAKKIQDTGLANTYGVPTIVAITSSESVETKMVTIGATATGNVPAPTTAGMPQLPVETMASGASSFYVATAIAVVLVRTLQYY